MLMLKIKKIILIYFLKKYFQKNPTLQYREHAQTFSNHTAKKNAISSHTS
jgi:hypothetical protein